MERRYILKFVLFVVEVVIKLVVEHFVGSCGSKVSRKEIRRVRVVVKYTYSVDSLAFVPASVWFFSTMAKCKNAN